MQKICSYEYENKIYEVVIEHKSLHQRSIRFRFKDGKFYVSSPYAVSNAYILDLLKNKFGPKMIKNQKPSAVGDNFIYIFGNRFDYPEVGKFAFSSGKTISYTNKDEFEKKMRKIFLTIITERVRYYEKIMKLDEHKVKVRKMSTRYGSNSKKTKSICFALSLYHYSTPIIDAIIVHELAHSIYFDHSDKFYAVVYKYCPDYKRLHTKLRKGEFI